MTIPGTYIPVAHRSGVGRASHILVVFYSLLLMGNLAGLQGLAVDSAFNAARLLEILGLFVCTPLLIWFPTLTATGAVRRKTIALVAAFICLGFTSAIQSRWPPYAIEECSHVLIIAVACLGITGYFINYPSSVRTLMLAIAAGVAIALFRLLLQISLTGITGIISPLTMWWLPYSNPRFLAQALVWVIPLLSVLPELWPCFRFRRSLMYSTLAAGGWFLLFWTGSRAEVFSLLLALAAVALMGGSRSWRRLCRMGAHAVAGFLFGLITHAQLEFKHLNEGTLSLARFGVSGRDWLYKRSLELITEHPWLGIGPAHFPAYNHHAQYGSAHPHNLLIEVVLEWGIPAGLLFVAMAAKFIGSTWRALNKLETSFDTPAELRNLLRDPLRVTLLAALISSSFDGIHIMPLSLLAAVPILGLILSFDLRLTTTNRVDWPARLIYVLLPTGLLWGLMVFYLCQQSDCLRYPAKAESIINGHVGYDHPRFWAQGRIPIAEGCLEIGRYQNGRDTLLNRSVDALDATEQYWR